MIFWVKEPPGNGPNCAGEEILVYGMSSLAMEGQNGKHLKLPSIVLIQATKPALSGFDLLNVYPEPVTTALTLPVAGNGLELFPSFF
jgi:hypothetical protein